MPPWPQCRYTTASYKNFGICSCHDVVVCYRLEYSLIQCKLKTFSRFRSCVLCPYTRKCDVITPIVFWSHHKITSKLSTRVFHHSAVLSQAHRPYRNGVALDDHNGDRTKKIKGAGGEQKQQGAEGPEGKSTRKGRRS